MGLYCGDLDRRSYQRLYGIQAYTVDPVYPKEFGAKVYKISRDPLVMSVIGTLTILAQTGLFE